MAEEILLEEFVRRMVAESVSPCLAHPHERNRGFQFQPFPQSLPGRMDVVRFLVDTVLADPLDNERVAVLGQQEPITTGARYFLRCLEPLEQRQRFRPELVRYFRTIGGFRPGPGERTGLK